MRQKQEKEKKKKQEEQEILATYFEFIAIFSKAFFHSKLSSLVTNRTLYY